MKTEATCANETVRLAFESSSLLDRAVYRPSETVFDVWFKHGSVPYRYLAVASSEIRELLVAPSAGSYFERVFKPKHPTPKLCVTLRCFACYLPIDPESGVRIETKPDGARAFHPSCQETKQQ